MQYSVSYFVFGLFAFGAILIELTHVVCRTEDSQRRGDWIKYAIYLFIIVGVLLLAGAGKYYLGGLLGIIVVIGTTELRTNLRGHGLSSILISLSFGVTLGCLLAHLLFSTSGLWYNRFVFLFLTAAVTDSYSQLWGKLFGKHRLCPNLSPGKTIEGLIGGVITAVVCSELLSWLLSIYSLPVSLWLGLLIALSAIVGDLLFSLIKRHLGIKDFSTMLPGHGGVLDRFDSLAMAAPVFYWVTKIFQS
jgi:CDP-diglyceride synthetase